MDSDPGHLLHAVLDSIDELAVLVDSHGKIVVFNRACEEATGYRRDEVLGEELIAALVPDTWLDAVRRRFADPFAAEVREPHENPWKTRSGEERLIRWRCTPVQLPGDASPHILGLGADVSEQRRLDARLQVQSRLMESFFESTLACAALLDRDFNFLRVNKSYADACGRDIAQFAGRNHFDVFPSDAKAIFEEVVATHRPYSVQSRPFEFPDHPEWGVTYWDWTLAPVLDERGNVEFLVFCLHDVTERHRTGERLEQAIAGMEALSHRLTQAREAERRHLALELHDEMGQELTAMKIALESLARPAAPGDAIRLGEAIAIAGLLQARVRAISTNLRPPMLEDMGLTVALPWLFERHRASTGLEVSFRHSGLEGRLPAEIETTVYRIVQEGLTNVVRHSGVRHAQVLLRATSIAVVLKVEDGGCGFDPDLAMASGESAGLPGLKERVHALGGRLAVESVPGTGTSLTAELPLPVERSAPGTRA